LIPGSTERVVQRPPFRSLHLSSLSPSHSGTPIAALPTQREGVFDDSEGALFALQKASCSRAAARILSRARTEKPSEQVGDAGEVPPAGGGCHDQGPACLRENMKALNGSPEEKALPQRYARQFDS
jgi:hypothetical protein